MLSSQVTKTFATVFWSALKVGAGVHLVFPGPAGRREQLVEPVGVRALIRIRDHLAAQFPVFAVFITRQSITPESNGTSKAAQKSLISCCENRWLLENCGGR
jgi:hypothetical protein